MTPSSGRDARPSGGDPNRRSGQGGQRSGKPTGRPARPAGPAQRGSSSSGQGRPARPVGQGQGRPTGQGRPARPTGQGQGRPARPTSQGQGRPARPSAPRPTGQAPRARRAPDEGRTGRSGRPEPRGARPRDEGARTGRPRAGERHDRRPVRPEPAPLPEQTKRWGGVSRRGARVVTEANTASAAWQDAVIRSRTRETGAPEHARDDAESWQTEVWVRDDEKAAPTPGRTRVKKERTLPPDVVRELAGAGPRRSAALEKRLGDAVRAYEAERYTDALRILKALADVAPASAAVRELNGLTLYRLGRWKVALSELQAAHLLSGSVDQYPVMADCARALGRHKAVAQRWEELRKASPSGEILAEGRIVMAGSLSDQGKVSEAIALLERSGADRARPRDHHLRSWYALADLYERAGDVPHARELFKRIARFDADFHDVAERLAAL